MLFDHPFVASFVKSPNRESDGKTGAADLLFRSSSQYCGQEDCTCESRVMCHTCHLYGSHQQHGHRLLLEEYEDIRSQLEIGMALAGEKEATCKNLMQSFDRAILSYDQDESGEIENHKETVRQHFAKLRAQLDTQESIAIEKLDDFAKSKYRTFKNAKQPFEVYLDDLESKHNKMKILVEISKVKLIERKNEALETLAMVNRAAIQRLSFLEEATEYSVKLSPLNEINLQLEREYNFYFFGTFERGIPKMKKYLEKNGTVLQENSIMYKNCCVHFWNDWKTYTIEEFVDKPGCVIFSMDYRFDHSSSLEELAKFKNRCPPKMKIVVAVNKNPVDRVKEELESDLNKMISVDDRLSFGYYDHAIEKATLQFFDSLLGF